MIQWQQSKEIKQWRRSLFEEEIRRQKKESDVEEGLMTGGEGGGKWMKKAKMNVKEKKVKAVMREKQGQDKAKRM